MARFFSRSRRHGQEDPAHWLLTRERFQLPQTEPPAPEPDLTLSDIIKNLFKGIDQRRQPALLDQVRKAWPELAGTRAAAHARPGYLDRQTLVIFVDSAVWLDELSRYERAGILERLQQRFGAQAVKAVRLQADPGDRANSPGGR
ncbi:MAG: DUF721 domain-containing protein [Lentisphaerae bacterium]|nr:DUF721 domain-containing protein [Lentisphaerota bacterium]